MSFQTHLFFNVHFYAHFNEQFDLFHISSDNVFRPIGFLHGPIAPVHHFTICMGRLMLSNLFVDTIFGIFVVILIFLALNTFLHRIRKAIL